MKKRTLFETLFDSGVVFGVCVTIERFGKRGSLDVGMSGKEYSVMIWKGDIGKVKGIGFSGIGGKEYPHLVEHVLGGEDVEDFKRLERLFKKVVHNKEGRVYELRGKSFSAYYRHEEGVIVERDKARRMAEFEERYNKGVSTQGVYTKGLAMG